MVPYLSSGLCLQSADSVQQSSWCPLAIMPVLCSSGTGTVTVKLPDSHLSAGCLRRPIAEARQATESLEPAVRELLSTRARGELLEAGAQRACSGISLHKLHCKAATQARTPSPKRSSPGKAALATDNKAFDGSASCSTVPEEHR